MTIDLTFYGATATVTGSKALVEVGGKRLLVDCGLFQGFKTLRERNWEPLPFDPANLDAVLLTHAHIDHSGALPLLMRQGFEGRIWTTAASAELCNILLQDTAHLQEEEARFRNRHGATKHDPAEPLYTVQDAKHALDHMHAVGRDGLLQLGDGVEVQFTPAGHILGASSVLLEIVELVHEHEVRGLADVIVDHIEQHRDAARPVDVRPAERCRAHGRRVQLGVLSGTTLNRTSNGMSCRRECQTEQYLSRES